MCCPQLPRMQNIELTVTSAISPHDAISGLPRHVIVPNVLTTIKPSFRGARRATRHRLPPLCNCTLRLVLRPIRADAIGALEMPIMTPLEPSQSMHPAFCRVEGRPISRPNRLRGGADAGAGRISATLNHTIPAAPSWPFADSVGAAATVLTC